MDMSFMSKFIVQGRDALECLNWVSCNDIDVPPGRLVYTQWVNALGGIEADLTITRLSEQQFMVVCSDTAHRHGGTSLPASWQAGAPRAFLQDQNLTSRVESLMSGTIRTRLMVYAWAWSTKI